MCPNNLKLSLFFNFLASHLKLRSCLFFNSKCIAPFKTERTFFLCNWRYTCSAWATFTRLNRDVTENIRTWNKHRICSPIWSEWVMLSHLKNLKGWLKVKIQLFVIFLKGFDCFPGLPLNASWNLPENLEAMHFLSGHTKLECTIIFIKLFLSIIAWNCCFFFTLELVFYVYRWSRLSMICTD